MGYFISIRPGLASEDLMAKYHIPDRAPHARVRCQAVGPDGNPCSNYTVIRPDSDGKRRCYFHHGDTASLVGQDPAFDDIMRRIAQSEANYEEEGSIFYYRDNYNYLKAHSQRLDTLIEVGCYLGGLSAIFALAAKRFGFVYYIVEYNLEYLLFTYERMARFAPDCLGNIRFYHGTLAEFVRQWRNPLSKRCIYLEIDAAHWYDGVVADLRASHAIRRGIHSIACHDFHLRSADWRRDLFVDRAIFSVFGCQAALRFIGFNTGDWLGDPETDSTGNKLYNKPHCFEGAIIHLAENGYCFDNVACRPAFRRLVRVNLRQWRDWLLGKMREFRGRKVLSFIYEPRERTGLELAFPIEIDKLAPKALQISVGESRHLGTVKRAFWQYDYGKAFVEIADPSAIRSSISDESVAKLDGLRVEGLREGQAQARLECGGFEREIAVHVLPKEAAGQNAAKTDDPPCVPCPSEARRNLLAKDVFPEDEFFAEMTKLRSPRILEIGARKVNAAMPRHLAGPNARFVGLDLLDGENVDVVGDAHRLSELFEPRSFDGVYSGAVFEHLAMPWRVALEINTVLRPGGLAYIASHHTFNIHELPWDFWRYGKDAWRTIFGPTTGFESQNGGLVWSAHLCRYGTKSALEGGDECYLFSHILARKVADIDPTQCRWDVDWRDVLPPGHVYPRGTGLSRDDRRAKKSPAPARAFLKPEGSVEELFAQFLAEIRRRKQPRALVLSCKNPDRRFPLANWGEASLCRVVYRGAEEARALYDLPDEQGRPAFDAIALIDVLGLVECPWAAALALAEALRPGGLLFVKDSQARPVLDQPDLWRFSSEALRVLFNPRIGFDIRASVLGDPCTLYPDSPGHPLMKDYDPEIPCYLSAACLAVRRDHADARSLLWPTQHRGQ